MSRKPVLWAIAIVAGVFVVVGCVSEGEELAMCDNPTLIGRTEKGGCIYSCDYSMTSTGPCLLEDVPR